MQIISQNPPWEQGAFRHGSHIQIQRDVRSCLKTLHQTNGSPPSASSVHCHHGREWTHLDPIHDTGYIAGL